MTNIIKHGRHHIETNRDPATFMQWPKGVCQGMLDNSDNGYIESVLVSETERVRIWHLHIAPGKRSPSIGILAPIFGRS
ncbi:MAG: hypothetical protein ACI85H_001756 [Paracoccaceae bacterium]|jgi:hypothetical protein